MKMAKALQCVSSLVVFNISDNNITCEASNEIASILPNTAELQTLDIDNK